MQAQCPTSGITVDGNAARLNGAIVTALLVVVLATGSRLAMAYLALDFGIKLLVGFPPSPNCIISRWIARVARVPENPMDVAPKRFAALLGFVMSASALAISYLPGTTYGVAAVLGVFLACAAVEAFVGVCVGCMLYSVMPPQLARAFVPRRGLSADDRRASV